MAFENFKGKKYTAVTASADTNKREIYKKTPAILRKGKEAKVNGGFFDYEFVVSKSNPTTGGDPNAVHVEQDPITLETAVYVTASVMREMFLTYFKTTAGFPSSSFTQISASFFKQIGDGMSNMPVGELASMLNIPFAIGSIGSGSDRITACTASFDFSLHPGIGGPGPSNPSHLVISNTSTNCLYSTFKFGNTPTSLNDSQRLATSVLTGSNRPTRSFDEFGFHYVQEDHVKIWSAQVDASSDPGNHVFALSSSYSSSEDFGVVSGALLADTGAAGVGPDLESPKYYAGGTDSSSGYFYHNSIKGFISGEGEFGDGEANGGSSFFPIKQFIYYPRTGLEVRSGSFLYSSESQGAAHASSSGTATTIYYISGANHTSGAFTGSFCGDATKKSSGSHLWLDANLRTAASAGFYAIPGTGVVLGGFIGGISGSAVYEGNSVTRETVPRFSSKSIH